MTMRLLTPGALILLSGCATTQIVTPAAPGPEAALRALGGAATHVELLDGQRYGGHDVRVAPDSVPWEWRGGRAAVPHCAVGALVRSDSDLIAERNALRGLALGAAVGVGYGLHIALNGRGGGGERLHPAVRVGGGAMVAVVQTALGAPFGATVGIGLSDTVGRTRRVEVRSAVPRCPEVGVSATGGR